MRSCRDGSWACHLILPEINPCSLNWLPCRPSAHWVRQTPFPVFIYLTSQIASLEFPSYPEQLTMDVQGARQRKKGDELPTKGVVVDSPSFLLVGPQMPVLRLVRNGPPSSHPTVHWFPIQEALWSRAAVGQRTRSSCIQKQAVAAMTVRKRPRGQIREVGDRTRIMP